MDIEKYRRLFVEEATDHLAEMASALASLESREGGDAEAAIDTLFRMAHSIKGMASSLDYDSVASVAHRLEDWLEPMREAGVLPARAASWCTKSWDCSKRWWPPSSRPARLQRPVKTRSSA